MPILGEMPFRERPSPRFVASNPVPSSVIADKSNEAQPYPPTAPKPNPPKDTPKSIGDFGEDAPQRDHPTVDEPQDRSGTAWASPRAKETPRPEEPSSAVKEWEQAHRRLQDFTSGGEPYVILNGDPMKMTSTVRGLHPLPVADAEEHRQAYDWLNQRAHLQDEVNRLKPAADYEREMVEKNDGDKSQPPSTTTMSDAPNSIPLAQPSKSQTSAPPAPAAVGDKPGQSTQQRGTPSPVRAGPLTLDEALKKGTISYRDLQRLHLDDDQTRQIISIYTDKEPDWTPEKVKSDAGFEPNRPGNTWNTFNETGRLRRAYPGKTDDEIAQLEASHRNETRAKGLLFQHMGGTDKDRFRILEALYDLASVSTLPLAVPSAASTPWVGPKLAAELGDTANHAIRIGEAALEGHQAGYELDGSKMLVGKTYKVNIFGLYRDKGELPNLPELVESLRNEAAEKGAERLQIIGSHVSNDKLKNPALVKRVAEQQGFIFQSADKRYILSMPVSPGTPK